MKIKIIAIGKLKEKYWVDATKEYVKRLGSYCDLDIIELKESRLNAAGASMEQKVLEEEGREILNVLQKNKQKNKGANSSGSGNQTFVITLEIKGKKFTSKGLAEKINALTLEGKSEIVFIIGGSYGLSKEVTDCSDMALSFSDMTFPHQMMRVILLEQIYRSFKIIKGETYHK